MTTAGPTPDISVSPTDDPQAYLQAFAERYGEAYLRLAYHAAFPMSLTPDLLYRIWGNIQDDYPGELESIPWVAVSDFLVASGFCETVGNDLYEVNPRLRQALLHSLEADSRFGSDRIQELAEFMLSYAEPQLNSSDSMQRDYAQVQRWGALAYKEPKQAARELAQALSYKWSEYKCSEDLDGLRRMATVVLHLADPLKDYPALLAYARGIYHYAREDYAGALAHLRDLLQANNALSVEGVTLPLPEIQVNADRTPPASHTKHKLVRVAFSVLGLILLVGGGFWLSKYARLMAKVSEISPPQNSENLPNDSAVPSSKKPSSSPTLDVELSTGEASASESLSSQDLTTFPNEPTVPQPDEPSESSTLDAELLETKASESLPPQNLATSPNDSTTPSSTELSGSPTSDTESPTSGTESPENSTDSISPTAPSELEAIPAPGSPVIEFPNTNSGIAVTPTSPENSLSGNGSSAASTLDSFEDEPSPLIEEDSSTATLNLSSLNQLLESGDWWSADLQTYRLLLESADKDNSASLSVSEVEAIPCSDLRAIDRRWAEASNGQQGFSVQTKIWQAAGSPELPIDSGWFEFSVRVGWTDPETNMPILVPPSNLENYPGHYPYSGATFTVASSSPANLFAHALSCGL